MREARELLVDAFVLVRAGALLRAELVVDAAPAGDEKHFAASAEDVLGAVDGDGGLDAGVLEDGLGMEDGEEATGDEVEDAQVVGAHLLERVSAARGDDGVVVGDLLVVDDAG